MSENYRNIVWHMMYGYVVAQVLIELNGNDIFTTWPQCQVTKVKLSEKTIFLQFKNLNKKLKKQKTRRRSPYPTPAQLSPICHICCVVCVMDRAVRPARPAGRAAHARWLAGSRDSRGDLGSPGTAGPAVSILGWLRLTGRRNDAILEIVRQLMIWGNGEGRRRGAGSGWVGTKWCILDRHLTTIKPPNCLNTRNNEVIKVKINTVGIVHTLRCLTLPSFYSYNTNKIGCSVANMKLNLHYKWLYGTGGRREMNSWVWSRSVFKHVISCNLPGPFGWNTCSVWDFIILFQLLIKN